MKLQASSIHRHVKCSGSWQLEQTLKDSERFNAFEGAASYGRDLHDTSEIRFKAAYFNNKKILTGTILKDKGYVKDSPEFDKGVHTLNYYAKVVKKINQKHKRRKGKTLLEIEEKHRIEKQGIDCVFKSDMLFSTVKNGVHYIDIMDLKTGNYNYSGSAFNQLLFSLSVFIEKFRIRKFNVGMHIIQPNYWNESERHVSKQLKNIPSLCSYIAKVKQRETEFNPGDYCTMCPAVIKCPKMQLTTNFVGAHTTIDIDNIDNDKLAQIMSQKKNIETFLKAVEQVTKTRLNEGNSVGNLTLVPRKGRRVWKDKEYVKKFLSYLGDDRFEPQKLKSPAQMEVLAGKENIKELCDQPTSLILKEQENVFKEVKK